MQESVQPGLGGCDAFQAGGSGFPGGDFACTQEVANMGQGMMEKL
jgi:hypothetical protein